MTNMIYTAMPALPKKHHTNAVVLPSEWNAYPLSSIAEEISETVGTRKIETISISAGIGFVNQAKNLEENYRESNMKNILFYTKEIFHTIKEILTYILRAVFTA